jgi:hypothetical protein
MENLALSARSLHALAEDLQGRVSRFQLGLSREQE